MRLFFALWPDDDAALRLMQTADRLNLESQSRRVDPKNFHVTLAFIGEVPAVRLAVLQQIGGSLRVPRFTFNCDSLEFWRDSRVVVVANREAPAELVDLVEKLHDAIGLPRERFRAHATLARKVTQAPVLQAMSPIPWHATSFNLIRSDTGGVESAYTVLDTWPLLYEKQNP